MNGKRTTTLLISTLAFVLLAAADLKPLNWASPVAPAAAESDFPYGAVVGLIGTPHLWIADENGVLHWGGDTRALRPRYVDWSTRIDVSLDTLKTLTRGDPYLTAGLLKDGEPIYLVKWETEESVPRLFHIQCIPDVELFGIKTENYLNFVIDRPDWESRTWEGLRLQASSLQRLELPGAATCGTPTGTPATPTATATATPTRPRISLSAADVNACMGTLQRYGLAVTDVNRDRAVTVALPPSVSSSTQAVVLQLAPLMRPPTSTVADLMSPSANIAIGLARFGRNLTAPDANSPANVSAGSYLVVVRGGDTPRTVLVSCSSSNEIAVPALPTVRRMLTRDVLPPQAIITSTGICYAWNRVQLCTLPSPRAGMSSAELSAMNQVMNQAVTSLAAAGRLQASDINVGSVLPDVEGAVAVQASRGSVLAAPASSWTGIAANNAIAGALHVDMEITGVPGTVRVPPGDYAVRVNGSTSTGWTAVLVAADGSQYQVPATMQEVLGSATTPDVAVVNLAFILSQDVQLCFFGECGP
jgi:hypothetical protein